MSEQKTHAEIIAEMRNRAKRPDFVSQDVLKSCADELDAAHKREVDALMDEMNEQIADLRQQRDLWSRRAAELVEKCDEQYAKLKQVGNAAKLREALEHMVRAETYGSMERDDLCGRCLEKMFARCNHDGTCWVDKAITALAAPPRNCDRFASAEEAWDAYDEWVDSYRAQGKTEPFNEFGWLFAPATEKEGGNDAD